MRAEADVQGSAKSGKPDGRSDRSENRVTNSIVEATITRLRKPARQRLAYHRGHPNQLRHTFATEEMRKAYGLEAACRSCWGTRRRT